MYSEDDYKKSEWHYSTGGFSQKWTYWLLAVSAVILIAGGGLIATRNTQEA